MAAFAIGWLPERVTGRRDADLLSTEIWQPSGAESAALLTAPAWRAGRARRRGLHPARTVVSERHLDILQRWPALLRAAADIGPESVDGQPIKQ